MSWPNPFYSKAEANVAALRSRFPSQFVSDGLYAWPDGWHSLVESVCGAAQRLQCAVYWSVIKEELGGLLMARRPKPGCNEGALFGLDLYFWQDVRPASLKSCSWCGKEGDGRFMFDRYVVLCEDYRWAYIVACREAAGAASS